MRLSHEAPSREPSHLRQGTDRPTPRLGGRGGRTGQRRGLVALAHELVCLASEIEARAVAREIRPAAFFDPGHLLVEPGNEQKWSLRARPDISPPPCTRYAATISSTKSRLPCSAASRSSGQSVMGKQSTYQLPTRSSVVRRSVPPRSRTDFPPKACQRLCSAATRTQSGGAHLVIGIAHRHKSIVEATGGVGVRVQQFRLPLDLIARKPAVVAVQRADIAAPRRLRTRNAGRSTSDYAEKVMFGFDCPSQPPNGRFLASRRSKRLR